MSDRQITKEHTERGCQLIALIEVCALAAEQVSDQYHSRGMEQRIWSVAKALDVAKEMAGDIQSAMEVAEGQPSDRLEAVE